MSDKLKYQVEGEILSALTREQIKHYAEAAKTLRTGMRMVYGDFQGPPMEVFLQAMSMAYAGMIAAEIDTLTYEIEAMKLSRAMRQSAYDSFTEGVEK